MSKDGTIAKAQAIRLREPPTVIQTENKLLWACCTTALILAAATTVAHAQDQTAGAADERRPVYEEIKVTGTRIRHTTDFNTPIPTTVVDDSYIRQLGLVNMGDAVREMPADISNNTPRTTGNSIYFSGSTIPNLRGLNPFFGSRTLTLVDSHRFVPTNQGDGVDLNFIPSVLIDHVDFVTGGASAAYGSGAIAGVENVFLDRGLEGGRLDFDTFQTSHNTDGSDRHQAVAYGRQLLNDRAHIAVGYEHQNTDPVNCLDRSWCREGNAFITGAAGGPSNVLAQDVRENQTSFTGVFNNPIAGATMTSQATADGTGLTTFNIGQGESATPLNNVSGGDGESIYQFANLTAPVSRDVAAGLFSFELNDNINMDVDVTYGKVESTNFTAALNDNLDLIHPDNAYVLLNPGLSAAVDPTAGAFLNKNWTSQLDSSTDFTTKVKRAVVGFDGQFGDSSWTWSGYYQYGNTERDQRIADNRHLDAYLMAVDSVLDGNGNPVCRVTRDGFAAAAAVSPSYALADPRLADGCVPLNPFGNQTIAPAARDYAFGTLDEHLDYTQQVAGYDVSGDIWKGISGGPFELAAGLEYRDEHGRNIDSQAGAADFVRTDYAMQYGDSYAGKVNVSEAFVELDMPLLSDKPAARLLEFNTAVRGSHYRNVGQEGTSGLTRTHDFTTWKVSGIYDPVDWLRIRTTRSRDVRAANFRELYYGEQIHAGGVFGFCGPEGALADPCDLSLTGNAELKPEKADTTTFGLVFTPKEHADGLQVAVDYFRIKINDAIQQANVRRILDGCQVSGLAEFCDLLVPDRGAGDFSYDPATDTGIQSLNGSAFNGSRYRFDGVDLSGSYTIAFKEGNDLSFRLLTTRMIRQDYEATPEQSFVNIVGQTGTSNSFLADNQPAAKWLSNLTATYDHNKFSITGEARYIGSGEMNYFGITPGEPGYSTATAPLVTMSNNDVPSYTVFSLMGSYTFAATQGVGLELYGMVDNVADKDPPIAAGTGFGANAYGGTNAVFYDTLGRAYRVGVRMNF